MNKLIQYIKDSITELKKVIWPSKKELTDHTLLVIAISLIVAIFIGLVDYGLTEVVNLIIR